MQTLPGLVLPKFVAAVALLVVTAMPARAEGRAELVTCKAMVEHATPSAQSATSGSQPDDAALARCRQIIRDWTLRESRMTVDENGRPLR
jgi:hypothetical protein